MELDQLRYPIGTFQYPENVDAHNITSWIADVETLPAKIREAVAGLSEEQLETPYRPDGWTVRQVIHHVADSHMNAYIRWHWTLTEDTPVIKAYHEKLWATLPDGQNAPIELSLALLDALHARWIYLIKSVSDEQLSLQFTHPETRKDISLRFVLGMYAWHGKHHTAHITELRKRMGW
jgi:hypothetical protein